MDFTPPPQVISILALFALLNHIVSFIYHVGFRSVALPRAFGAFAVMLFYVYLQLHPTMSLEARALVARWCFVFLFLPEGYPITYLLAKRWVKHAGHN